MMKKFITIGAVLVLSLSMLAGCGNSTSNEADTKTENEVIAEQSSEKNEEVVENSEAIAEVVPETETTDVVDEPEDVVETTEEVPENSEAVEEPVAPKTEYTYSALDKTMYAKSSVNVRDLPSTDGERVGGLSARQEVHVTGQCNETGWYRIDYNGAEAFVSNSYIVAERPAEPEQPKPDEPKPDNPVVENFPHALNSPWYDASTGEVYFYTVGKADPLDANYQAAFDILTQHYGPYGLRTVGKFNEYVGTYAEGKIYFNSARYLSPEDQGL